MIEMSGVGLNQKIEAQGNGSVKYGGTEMSVQELVMMVFMMKAEVMSSVAADRASDAQSKLDLIKKARSFLTDMDVKKNDAKTATAGNTEMPSDMKAFMKENNIKWDTTGNDDYHDPDQWDINKQYMNDFIDKQSSNNDLQMIKLKSVINKQQEAVQGSDSMVGRIKELGDRIWR